MDVLAGQRAPPERNGNALKGKRLPPGDAHRRHGQHDGGRHERGRLLLLALSRVGHIRHVRHRVREAAVEDARYAAVAVGCAAVQPGVEPVWHQRLLAFERRLLQHVQLLMCVR